MRLHLCVLAAVLLSVSAMSAPVSAAYIPVYGAPVPGYSFPAVNNSGAAVGFSFRWNATGSAQLGNLSGGSRWATDINSAGTAVGGGSKSTATTSLGTRAIRWPASGTAPTELGTLATIPSGYTESEAHAISDTGIAVGYSYKYLGGKFAVRWNASGTAATELGHLGTSVGGFANAEATAVNNFGTAIGYSDKFNSSGENVGRYAVRWDASGAAATQLGAVGTHFPGGEPTIATAINSAGTVVGVSIELESGLEMARPVRWDASGAAPTRLAVPGETYHGNVFDINDAGAAVGNVIDSLEGYPFKAARWDASGAITVLESLEPDSGFLGRRNSWAVNINAAGIAVGYGFNDGGDVLVDRALYWGLDGAVVDLNSLIDPASGWTLSRATSSSDTGWIGGVGRFDPDGPGGQAADYRMFLLQLPILKGDFDADGDVDGDDLVDWRSGYGLANGAGSADGDADGDNDVDGADFLVWQRQLRSGTNSTRAAIPEPTTCLLFIVAATGIRCLGRRMRQELVWA